MTTTLLTPEAKDALRKGVRSLRALLLDELARAAKGEYQLDVAIDKARLSAVRRARRQRVEDWLDEQVRSTGKAAAGKADKSGKASKAAKAGKVAGKGDESDLRARFFGQAVAEAAHTLVNRLVLVRILEHHGLIAPDAPPVVTGGWKSGGYAGEFLGYAGPLADDDARGYRHLLDAIFAELGLELPGLFGNVGLTALFPVPASTLRAVLELLNDPALASAWGDDTTLGWVYQFWNDPQREELDKKIKAKGKIEPHEIASKTQMFTERYMVEWLLHNSLGFTWLCICKKNGWTPDAESVLPDLDARRAAWRKQREAGEVALDALMPIAPGLESDWKYYVPQPVPDDAVEKAPRSIADVKLLDPACGSGHFLVIAFGLLARMYEEEARHRGETGEEAWSAAEIARRIVADNLHGIDIDARAIQIAAAGLWLRARLHAQADGRGAPLRLSRMNLVAPSFRLASLPKDDPARAALEAELATLGVPRETTSGLVEALKGVDHLGTLLRVDREIASLFDDVEEDEGPLQAWGAKRHRARLEGLVASFLDAHASESDLGLRLEGEQLAAGVRFIELAREGRYDMVVGNPPYQGLGKVAGFEYVAKNYPRGKADLYAAFLERGLELVRESGLSALLTMRGWMFLGKGELRTHVLHEQGLQVLGDVDRGAFEDVPDEVLATVMSVIRRTPAGTGSLALQPTPPDDRSRDSARTARKRAALLAQVGRHEFDPKAFAAIEGEPIVYWWTDTFLARYAAAPKLGEVAPARATQGLYNNTRFTRRWHEVPTARISATPSRTSPWAQFTNGSDGAVWFESTRLVARWAEFGMEAKEYVSKTIGSQIYRFANEHFFFRDDGVAFSMVGANFSARKVLGRGIFGDKGRSVFGLAATVTCLLNSKTARSVMQSLNPTISFQAGDVNRMALFDLPHAEDVIRTAERAFSEHESAREGSILFRAPRPSGWRFAEGWAQSAVDREAAAPLAPYHPEHEPPVAQAIVSFAIGVLMGRFAAAGDGVLDVAPASALDAGILFVSPSDAYLDSLACMGIERVNTAWEALMLPSGKKPALRDWLRKDFFAFHKALYENRPIYFPLSSEKRSFVAWVSIHRFTDSTLSTLLADHLTPVLRQLDAEIRDANAARASADKKAAISAGKTYDTAKRLRDELADFVALVSQCAERGAPPTDPGCPPREVDATFSMDLDDGVMINSAALWPLLAPQWSEPKKWWKQLCLAEGKDYDWAHLAKRYFPTRVDAKCKSDPSLAVAHGCFWRYHPAKAFAWELRLQDEIRADFTIDETDSDEHRAAYLRDHAADAEAARQKERVRRERKAAKEDSAESDRVAEGDDDESSPASEDDDA